MTEIVEHLYRPAGAIKQLWHCRDPELLVEGPANCGKTRGILEWCNWIAETYPNTRQLWVRQTRKSLTESVLVTWEEHVLWPGHPAIVGEAHRGHRDFYRYPDTGAYIVLGGMDHPDRFMSAEYDVIVFFEATEGTVEGWEKVTTRLRNKRMPWQPAVADCNPGSEMHWLNQRANAGKMRRLIVRHDSNPIFTPADRDRLEALTGARRKRLLDGLWVSEEGQIWENYDPAVHLVSGEIVREKATRKGLWLRYVNGVGLEREVEIKWTGAGLDWGFTAPGSLCVFGVDGEGCAYMLAEVYRTKQTLDWWAERVVELHKEFDLRIVVADPSRPESIEQMNTRLGEACGRPAGSLVRPADNKLTSTGRGDLGGLDQVRWALDGRLFFLRDSLRYGKDPDLQGRLKPLCLADEIPSYTFLKIQADKPQAEKDERPDPTCADHACDAVRYFACYAWQRDLSDPAPKPRFEPGSLGDLLGHGDVLDSL